MTVQEGYRKDMAKYEEQVKKYREFMERQRSE